MRSIKMTLEYDGTHFHGWQVQVGQRTVQGDLETALQTIFNKTIRVHGSGRTDSGVHALGQVAHFKTGHLTMPPEVLCRALNARLPPDIAVTQAETVTPSFHARYSARSKTYRYSILNTAQRHPLLRRTRWQIPYRLNVACMRREAKFLLGRHDFRSFAASDPARRRKGKDSDTVRTVKRLDIKKKGNLIDIEIEANGFLYKMVRNIIGTLVAVGCGRREEGYTHAVLQGRNRSLAAETAAPNGLCLVRVAYGKTGRAPGKTSRAVKK